MSGIPRGWFAQAIAAFCGWSAVAPALPLRASTIVVDSLADPGAPYDGLTTLREALMQANAAGGDVTISFDLILTGGTIQPTAQLPALAAPGIRIDGDLDDDATPDIELDGSLAGAAVGIAIESNGGVVDGLIINRFESSGVRVGGPATAGNTVQGCFLGTDRSGLVALRNREGVWIAEGASLNTIGPGNVVSGNDLYGVLISGLGTRDNIVHGNKIGTDPGGNLPVPNDGPGVKVTDRAEGNSIGPANTISGNNAQGLVLSNGASENIVFGNRIGTDSLGLAAVPNHWEGITIQGGAIGNRIGGTDVEANVISGNLSNGISIRGAASMTQIAGNKIGTDLAGQAAIPNVDSGIAIESFATGITIGPSNVISGNGGFGVLLSGPSVTRSVVHGNFVGTNAAGTSAVRNSGPGVALTNGASDNTVGPSNVISGNLSAGILLENGAHSNSVIGNLVGTDLSGLLALSNFRSGILIQAGANENTIGGVGGNGNLCSCNREDGITVLDANSDRNVIAGNSCGTDSTGDAVLPNEGHGVHVAGGAADNVIGPANRLAGNRGHGVQIADSASFGNSISSNAIWGNAGLGIWLKDGGNDAVPSPLISSASATKISGRVAAADASIVQIFKDAYNEGRILLGSAMVLGTRFEFLGGDLTGESLTANVTDPEGNTSAFRRSGDESGRRLMAMAESAGTLFDLNTNGPAALRGETGIPFARGCLAHRSDGQLFAITRSGDLYRIGTTSPTATWLRNIGYPEVEACAFGPDGRLYVAAGEAVDGEEETPASLVRVHPESLNVAAIGTMAVDIDALAFVSGGRLIGIDTHLVLENEVYSINLATAGLTLLSTIPHYNIISLAFDGDSLFALDSRGGVLEVNMEAWSADMIFEQDEELGAIVSATSPPLVFADFNGDGSTDAGDFRYFKLCYGFSGPGVPAMAACPSSIDWDDDRDVDLRDFRMLQIAFRP